MEYNPIGTAGSVLEAISVLKTNAGCLEDEGDASSLNIKTNGRHG